MVNRLMVNGILNYYSFKIGNMKKQGEKGLFENVLTFFTVPFSGLPSMGPLVPVEASTPRRLGQPLHLQHSEALPRFSALIGFVVLVGPIWGSLGFDNYGGYHEGLCIRPSRGSN
jgi:hypothetical protein